MAQQVQALPEDPGLNTKSHIAAYTEFVCSPGLGSSTLSWPLWTLYTYDAKTYIKGKHP